LKWLLKIYPPAWRRRYEEEMAALLEEHRAGQRSVLDLLRGAADAWTIGPRGPLGGLEIWLAVIAYGAATVGLVVVGRAVHDSLESTVMQGLHWAVFLVFVYWLSRQPAARCSLRWPDRSRR
jgi:hypothetical protein